MERKELQKKGLEESSMIQQKEINIPDRHRYAEATGWRVLRLNLRCFNK